MADSWAAPAYIRTPPATEAPSPKRSEETVTPRAMPNGIMVEDIASRSARASWVGPGSVAAARDTGAARRGSTTVGRVRTVDTVGFLRLVVCIHRAGGTPCRTSEAAT